MDWSRLILVGGGCAFVAPVGTGRALETVLGTWGSVSDRSMWRWLCVFKVGENHQKGLMTSQRPMRAHADYPSTFGKLFIDFTFTRNITNIMAEILR
ncbi:hypothetical protein AVEN_36483-1 [Araneus ventricosus]|uniref:Uncharacterized protein n=1 Tax=Araneus ventricosus TaxID=182803 RepID=A0A4Y2SSK4_ARAVE|nr:hypothetical protein AVEN_36483-1 [Araneus ventricosus]